MKRRKASTMTARKAQISWFIVLGLVFLIMLLIVSWLAYSTRFMSKKSQQLISSESELEKVKTYLESCEEGLAEEALILVGNQGGKTEVKDYFEVEGNKVSIVSNGLPSLEDISKDVSAYIDKKLARTCMPEAVTKKAVETSRPKTSITFNDKETVVETNWEVTLTFENNTKQGINTIKFSLPVRMKLVYETVLKDLETPGQTNLNFVDSLDKIDLKKIKYQDHVLGVIIDHKSKIKDKDYYIFAFAIKKI